jgi:hypothetical protein
VLGRGPPRRMSILTAAARQVWRPMQAAGASACRFARRAHPRHSLLNVTGPWPHSARALPAGYTRTKSLHCSFPTPMPNPTARKPAWKYAHWVTSASPRRTSTRGTAYLQVDWVLETWSAQSPRKAVLRGQLASHWPATPRVVRRTTHAVGPLWGRSRAGT